MHVRNHKLFILLLIIKVNGVLDVAVSIQVSKSTASAKQSVA